MEKKANERVLLPISPDTRYESWVVPLVNQNEVGTFQPAIELKRVYVVLRARQIWTSRAKLVDCLRPVIGKQIHIAPGIFRFEDLHVMTASLQFRNNAPQEMSISVVPIRDQ